jgi:hypothetical protein
VAAQNRAKQYKPGAVAAQLDDHPRPHPPEYHPAHPGPDVGVGGVSAQQRLPLALVRRVHGESASFEPAPMDDCGGLKQPAVDAAAINLIFVH